MSKTNFKNITNVEIIKGDYSHHLTLVLAPAVKAGFPSACESSDVDEAIDFNKDIIQHPDSTFYGRVIGDSMIDAGINEGDIVIIDRSIEPQPGDIIIGYLNQEYTMKYYDDSHLADGYVELIPANKKYPTFKVTKDDDFTIWGVVLYSIKTWTRRSRMGS